MPELIITRQGRKYNWSADEDAFITSRRKSGWKLVSIATAMQLPYKIVAKRANALGLASSGNVALKKLFDEEFYLLEEFALKKDPSRSNIQEHFKVTGHRADLLRDMVLAIRGRNALKKQADINATVTKRGRLKVSF